MIFKNNVSLESAFCTRDEFEVAKLVTAGCYQTGDPVFKTGFFGPSAVECINGHGWFSLDYACMVDAAKWLDFEIAKDFNRNMIAVQEADGRIRLDTNDTHKASANGLAVGTDEVSSLPQLMITAYKVAVMSGEEDLIRGTFAMLYKALDWWFKKRQDPGTKLISAVTEETFIANHMAGPLVYAPMDTNEKIIIGCENAALLADMLSETEKAEYLRGKKREVIDAVERYLWNEADGCYYPYLIPQGEQYKVLLWHTLLGFSFTTEERKKRLTKLLLDHEHFNWNTFPVTTVSKKDKIFVSGVKDGFGPDYISVDAAWRGSIQMPSNIYVIEALERGGRKDLAADLALKTVKEFSDYRLGSFVDPFTGIPEGLSMSYGWTASGYLQIILEKLIGLDYSPKTGLTVTPNLPVDCPENYRYIKLSNFKTPDGRLVNIDIKPRGNITIAEL